MKLTLIGDISLNGLFINNNSENYKRFQNIIPIFKDSFCLCNLESPIINTKNTKILDNNYIFTNYDIASQIFNYLNIKAVSLANNHILDYGINNINYTINSLKKLNIYATGLNFLEPIVFDLNNFKIAFMAYLDEEKFLKESFFTTNWQNLMINTISIYNLKKIKNIIKEYKKFVDIIILSIHWGNDYSNFFTKKQQELAHDLINSGVDIIMGHHPHTIQPYEIYNNKVIFYSLGQLCFGDFYWENKLRALRIKTKLGMVIRFNNLNNLLDFEVIPTYELKYNFLIIPKINITKKIKILFFFNKLILRFKAFQFIFLIKETVFDRIWNFLFGYYRNPLKEIFKIYNYKKIKYIKRDINLIQK